MPNHNQSWEQWSNADYAAIDAALRAASPAAVESAFTRIMPNFAAGNWLTTSHRMHNPRGALRGGPPHRPTVPPLVAEYAAASAPLHLSDAWTYFGRAISALAMGSADVAQHLLYYCELRAAHALLSRFGVMLLSEQNFVLTATGTTVPIPMPNSSLARNSHQAMWILLRHWSRTQESTSFCGRSLSLSGVSLEKWVDERPQVATLHAVVGTLMDQWGIDLVRFGRDRKLRNQLSYNPTRLKGGTPAATPQYIADLYQQIWMLLEPGQANPFEMLDSFVVRHAFDAFVLQGTAQRSLLASKAVEDMNREWTDRVLGAGQGKFVIDFLGHPRLMGDPGVLAAAGVNLADRPLLEELTGMIGRALILLRLSTGATRELLSRAGATPLAVDFWISELLEIHGIEKPASAPQDYVDMYDDIRDGLADLEPVIETGSAISEMSALKSQFATQLEALSGFERVPAWAVA